MRGRASDYQIKIIAMTAKAVTGVDLTDEKVSDWLAGLAEKPMPISKIAKQTGINHSTLKHRIESRGIEPSAYNGIISLYRQSELREAGLLE